jgi:hypothetical protein
LLADAIFLDKVWERFGRSAIAKAQKVKRNRTLPPRANPLTPRFFCRFNRVIEFLLSKHSPTGS